MNTIEEIDPLRQLFEKEFPKFYSFVYQEIRMLKFSADLALCYCDEDSCRKLNQKAEELFTALNVLIKRYSMDLFE